MFHFSLFSKMKNILLALVFLVTGSATLHGQNRLRGKITEEDKKTPVIGAAVYIHDLKRGVLSDTAGRFSIPDLPAGTFVIEARCIGYSTQTLRVTISGETTVQFVLPHAATEISEVTVTGTSAATQRRFNPVPVSTLNINDIRQSAATNVVAALGQLPGVTNVSTGAAISKPVIRGLGYNRVLVLNDGIRQEGQQWGDEHGVEIDGNSVEKVEVIKGPGSLMYGSDALAGVVNFISTDPVEQGRISGLFESMYQTNSGLYNVSAMNQGNIKGFTWLARVSQKQAGDFSNRYDGKVYNSGFNEFNVNGYFGLSKSWGYSYLRFSSFDQHIGLVEGERDSLGHFVKQQVINDSTVEAVTVSDADLSGYHLDIPRQHIRHLRVQSDSKFFIGKQSIATSFAFQQNTRSEFGDPLAPTTTELQFLLNTINYDVKWFLPDYGGWQTALGIGGMQQQNTNKGEEQLIPDYNLFDAGIFAVTQKTFSRFHLAFGLRVDNRSLHGEGLYLDSLDQQVSDPSLATTVKFTDFKRSFTSLSGSVGGSYRIAPHLVGKLNAARAFRAPTFSELAANGRHEGTFRYELGNTMLKPETGLQFDAGLVFDRDHFSVEANAFGGVIDNFIFLHKLAAANGGDSIPDPLNSAPAFKYVQGNAQRFGGELAVDFHPHPLDWLHFENAFSIVEATLAGQSDSMKYLPFTPAPRFRSELRTSFGKAGKYMRTTFVKFDVQYVFPQNKVYSAFGTETATPAYTLLDAAAGATFVTAKGKTLFTLTVNAENLADAVYQDHLSRLKYAPENLFTGRSGIYAPGRNFSFRLTVPLVFKKPPAQAEPDVIEIKQPATEH